MEISNVLNRIGLEDKESMVYLALLELGTADVSDIAKKAGIKRPTCYLVLDDLKNKGLVSQVPAKVNLFTAESPEKLAVEMYKKQELYKRFLPNLLALHNTKKEKPQVQLFEGKEAVRQVYQNIYQSPEVWFFGSIREIASLYPEEFRIFLQRVKAGEIKARDLFVFSEADLAYGKKQPQHSNYEIRFLPGSAEAFITDAALYGETVAFFSFHPRIFVVLIKSKEISGTFKILYEAAWKGAKNTPV